MRTLAALGLLLTGTALIAAEPPDVPRAVLDKQLVETLRDVHNKAAVLYNSDDAGGCYRTLYGMLLTVRPLVGHRPDVQKQIDDGLADTERQPSVWKRAYLAHELVVKVRDRLKGDAPPPTAAKDIPKAEALPMPREVPPASVPKSEPKKVAKGGASDVSGKLTVMGKPMPGAGVYFVQRDVAAPRVGSAVVAKDGTYAVKGLPAGKYSILIAPTAAMPKELAKAIPAKYEYVSTSMLLATFNGEPQVTLDLNLQ